MSDKICPLKTKRSTPPYVEKGLVAALEAEVFCIKEKCAWWLKAITTNPNLGALRVIRQAGCAIKLLAEK